MLGVHTHARVAALVQAEQQLSFLYLPGPLCMVSHAKRKISTRGRLLAHQSGKLVQSIGLLLQFSVACG